jgi:outer membrane protein assembly factor BamB
VATGEKPTAVTPPAKLAAPAIAALGGVVAPLTNGSVALLGTASDSSVTPFLPSLVPDALPQWTRPVPLADGAGFVISDGLGAVYAVTKRDQPKPHLEKAGEKNQTLNPVVSPLVLAGSTVIGVMRQENTDAIVGFDSRAKTVFEPVPLEGRVESGPFAVGGIALVAAEPDGLVCIGGDGRVRWQQPPENGFLAGAPLALPEGDLLVAYQSGVVCRLDAATGKELSRREIGEPLAGPAVVWKSHAYLSGSDGVVHRISLPPRP